QQTGSLTFGPGVNSDADLTGGVVLNERNFDILQPPTRIDDPFRGNSFRGAGQEFGMEAGPGPVKRFKIGGDFLFLNSLEYQVPVRTEDGIFLDAFVDSGTVVRKGDIQDYRVSAGFVVPVMGPVPIAPDFPVPLS